MFAKSLICIFFAESTEYAHILYVIQQLVLRPGSDYFEPIESSIESNSNRPKTIGQPSRSKRIRFNVSSKGPRRIVWIMIRIIAAGLCCYPLPTLATYRSLLLNRAYSRK